MKRTAWVYPWLRVDARVSRAVGQAGGVLLTRTANLTGLAAGLSAALAPWRKPFATHDPGKVIVDLALSLALGGDCLADVRWCGASRLCSAGLLRIRPCPG